MCLSAAPSPRPRVPLALVLALAPLAGLTACHTTPQPPMRYVDVLYEGTLEEASPADVVVAPIENSAAEPEAPLTALRDAFAEALVKRHYSPLAFDYVDRQVTEASYTPGSLSEHAVLRVDVKRWDLTRFKSHGVVTVELEAWMLDASQPGQAELWGGRLARDVDLSQATAKWSTNALLFASACDQLALELLEAMPARIPKP
jgi:hypothetical protein